MMAWSTAIAHKYERDAIITLRLQYSVYRPRGVVDALRFDVQYY